MSNVLAIDIGTSAIKVAVVNESLNAILDVEVKYTTYRNKSIAEQNPNDWWLGICTAISQIHQQMPGILETIEAIGLSGHMMGLVAVDGKGEVLRPAMIHADTRATREMQQMIKVQGKENLYRLTGNVCNPAANLFKMLWLKEEEPEVYKAASRFLQVKDYIVYRLTGNMDSTDYSDASHGMLLDISKKKYLEDLMKEHGLNVQKLPEIHKSSDVVGVLHKDVAAILGMKAGIPVTAGGGDGACANMGAGIRNSDIYCCLGTTAWIACYVNKPIIDEKQRVFHVLSLDGENCGVFGTMQCAGRSVTWAQELFHVSTLKKFDEMADMAAAGCDGLIFLPYLEGERSPIFDARARGMFWGICTQHEDMHFVRAVLEGVGYGLRSILDVMREREAFKEMRIIGGGAKSQFWKQMLADICQIDLLDISVKASVVTAVGAAAAAFVGTGQYTWNEVINKINICGRTDMNEESSLLYQKNYEKYLQIYPAVKNLYY